jgi:hypothetical protein
MKFSGAYCRSLSEAYRGQDLGRLNTSATPTQLEDDLHYYEVAIFFGFDREVTQC